MPSFAHRLPSPINLHMPASQGASLSYPMRVSRVALGERSLGRPMNRLSLGENSLR